MPTLKLRPAAPADAGAVPLTKQRRRRTPESQARFKQQLLDHAKELYRTNGNEALSIRSVTEAFKISPMAFYGYFDSKQDLVKHIWIDFFQDLLDRLVASGQGKRSPLQVIEAHVLAYIDYWEQHPDQYRMVYLADMRDAPGHDPVQFNQTEVSRRIIGLTRERILACCQGKPLGEKAVRMVMDRMFVAGIGYLHATIAVQRYELVDAARLKRLVVKDVMAMLVEATA